MEWSINPYTVDGWEVSVWHHLTPWQVTRVIVDTMEEALEVVKELVPPDGN